MSHLVALSDTDEPETRLTGCCWKVVPHILFHSDTGVLVNLSKRSDVQSGDFILLKLFFTLALLDVSSVLLLSEFVNQ